MSAGLATDALVRQEDVVHAVRFLATQSPRGMTHELVITAAGDRWLPWCKDWQSRLCVSVPEGSLDHLCGRLDCQPPRSAVALKRDCLPRLRSGEPRRVQVLR